MHVEYLQTSLLVLLYKTTSPSSVSLSLGLIIYRRRSTLVLTFLFLDTENNVSEGIGEEEFGGGGGGGCVFYKRKQKRWPQKVWCSIFYQLSHLPFFLWFSSTTQMITILTKTKSIYHLKIPVIGTHQTPKKFGPYVSLFPLSLIFIICVKMLLSLLE